MADDEGSSIWGAGGQIGNQGIGEGSKEAIEADISNSKPAPRLFDDLGDADWGSPELDEPTKIDLANTEDEVASISEQTGSLAIDGLAADKVQEDEDIADFDDFEAGGERADGDDDFGDFGDFEENAEDDDFGEADNVPSTPISAAPVVASTAPWRPLHLDSNTDSQSLARDIRQLLSAPLADGREHPFHDGAASQLSQDKIRQVDGQAQLLVSDESRKVWSALTNQPNLKPVDWMRSKTRRQYLIAIGIPINLDELNTTGTNGKALPPLALKLDGKSDTIGAADEKEQSKDGGKGMGRAAKERESSKPPDFDVERAKQVVAMTEDQLTLQSLPALRTMMREVETLTKQASKVLTFHLSQRENHTADAEMYNGLIRDLVTGAAKRVSASNNQSASGVARKSSVRVPVNNQRPASGRNSPAVGIANSSMRSGSPRT